jgi:hypothetical protein
VKFSTPLLFGPTSTVVVGAATAGAANTPDTTNAISAAQRNILPGSRLLRITGHPLWGRP